MQEHRLLMAQIQQTLDEIDVVLRAQAVSDLVLSQLAQHLCVRISGLIEIAVKENIVRLIDDPSRLRASRFIRSRVGDFQNPRPNKIFEMFGSIDSELADEMKQICSNGTSDAIGSLIAQRNKIAHGEFSDVTIRRVKEWFVRTKEFCDYLASVPA